MYDWDKNSDDYLDAVTDARIEKEMDGYDDFCEENDLDPEDPDALDSWKDARDSSRNPYKHYGVNKSDFL